MKNLNDFEYFKRSVGDFIKRGDINYGLEYEKDSYDYVPESKIGCKVVSGDLIYCPLLYKGKKINKRNQIRK